MGDVTVASPEHTTSGPFGPRKVGIMSARTNTKTRVATKSREEIAEAVTSETMSEAAGRRIAAYLVDGLADAETRIFTLAEYTHGALITGAKPADVSKAIAVEAARLIDDETRRAFALNTSISKGGVAMTGNAVKQYAAARASILSGGMTPTVQTVVVAFRAFTSAGAKGLSEAHTKLLGETKALPEGERDAFYLANAVARAKAVKDASAKSKSENAATASADEKSETVSEKVELDSLADVLAFIKATAARPWSDDDKATLAAAFTAAADSLA